jgi:hypothetical protein
MIKFFTNTLDRVLSLIFGVVFAQIPQFIQHYIQQLSGRVEELRMQVESMRYAASLSGKSLEQFIHKFQKNADPDFIHQGDVMSQVLGRYEQLSTAYTHMETAAGIEQPFTFFYYVDWSLAKSTMAHFSLGLPLTLEAGVYALCGIVCCHAIFVLIRKTGSKLLGLKSA